VEIEEPPSKTSASSVEPLGRFRQAVRFQTKKSTTGKFPILENSLLGKPFAFFMISTLAITHYLCYKWRVQTTGKGKNLHG